MENIEETHDRPTQPISLPSNWEDDGGAEKTPPPMPDHSDQAPDDAEEAVVRKGWMRRVAEAEEPETLSDEVPFSKEDLDVQGGPVPPETVAVPIPDEETWRQDEIDTPLPLPVPQEGGRAESGPRGASCFLRAVVGLCLVLSLLSLALNVFLIYRLMDVQRKATAGLNEAIASLEDIGKNGLHYEFQFENTIPFSGDIPFKQDLVFPFDGEIPFKSTIKVPVDLGILQTVVEVPVDTSVKISTSVPIHVDETIHIDTAIPISLTIPIDIEPGDPAIQQLISPIREWLLELLEMF